MASSNVIFSSKKSPAVRIALTASATVLFNVVASFVASVDWNNLDSEPRTQYSLGDAKMAFVAATTYSGYCDTCKSASSAHVLGDMFLTAGRDLVKVSNSSK